MRPIIPQRQLLLACIVLLALLLNSGCVILPTKDFNQAIGSLMGITLSELLKDSILLSKFFVDFYEENNRWPRDTDEFEGFVRDYAKDDIKDLFSGKNPFSKEYVRSKSNEPIEDIKSRFLNNTDLELSLLENGDMLLEGRFKELKLTFPELNFNLGQCRFSLIAHKDEQGIYFRPSGQKTEGESYIDIKMEYKFDEKQPSEIAKYKLEKITYDLTLKKDSIINSSDVFQYQ